MMLDIDTRSLPVLSKPGSNSSMPHLERAIFPWQCGHYPADHKSDEVTPWIDALINARKWVEANKK